MIKKFRNHNLLMFSRSTLIGEEQFQVRLTRVLNAFAVIAVFMIIALMVNQPLRAELAKSVIEDQSEELASQSQEAVEGKSGKAVSLQPVMWSTSPEVDPVPVPSIAHLANKIPESQIDPLALDAKLMTTYDQQLMVADYLANKYRADPARVREYVSHVVVVAKEVNLDPVLLVAVMAIESNFNPRAQSFAGAQGLMQVMTRVHLDKYAPYGGAKAAFKPEANIRVGAYILKGYIAMSGSMQRGLRYYVGGPAVAVDGGYVGKVLREREDLHSMLQKADTQTASRSIFSLDI